MVHYENIILDLVKLKNFISPPEWHSYTEIHFSEDWISRKDIDWKVYLVTFLDNVQDLKNQYLPIIDQEFEESDGFSVFFGNSGRNPKYPKEICLKYHDEEFYEVKSQEEQTKMEQWDFSRHHITLIENLELDLQKCFKFHETNKELPPYSERVLSIDKIPFWGDQMEMTLLLHLLFESDFIPIRKRGTREFKKDVSTEGKKQFDSHATITKKYAVELACTYFKGVTIEKKTIKEQVFNSGTVHKKMDDILLSEISSKNLSEFEERLSFISERFKSIKAQKELPSSHRARTT